MMYRPEIDGLRAIAVLSVLIYHAKFVLPSGDLLLAGGYLGVDIFFVISGYLITKIILQDIRADKFSYADFYERRARRILPALFTVILFSIPFAWEFMLPEQLLEYAHSVLGAIFFSSNFVFFFEDSYTAAPSALKPFLHTWSLGIEEQFYIVLPLILMLLVGRLTPRMLFVFISAIGLFSLFFSKLFRLSTPMRIFSCCRLGLGSYWLGRWWLL
jgi:peptidoglycan/LPS O-acetylase OafA/YrhL